MLPSHCRRLKPRLAATAQEADAQAKFTEVRKAYDTLSDPAKREVYDRYGREATERMESTGGDPGVRGKP